MRNTLCTTSRVYRGRPACASRPVPSVEEMHVESSNCCTRAFISTVVSTRRTLCLRELRDQYPGGCAISALRPRCLASSRFAFLSLRSSSFFCWARLLSDAWRRWSGLTRRCRRSAFSFVFFRNSTTATASAASPAHAPPAIAPPCDAVCAGVEQQSFSEPGHMCSLPAG